MAGISRVAGRGALVPVGAQRLLPPAALPRALVRVARVDRPHHVPRLQRERRHAQRALRQTLGAAMHPRKLVLLAAALALTACATASTSSRKESAITDEQVLATLRSSFHAKGQANLERLQQDEVQ